MLHEILLSLSGHQSPLLKAELSNGSAASIISPSERQLLASAAHLSDVHIKLIKHAGRVATSHPSTICRAIATAIQSTHLAAFQRKVLEVEESILKDDPDLVGAYNIVPLTAVMAEFQQWTRRMEWLWEVVQFMEEKDASSRLCWGSMAIDKLRLELQSGYKDIQEATLTLVKAAETAWLRQVSTWVLYGRLPTVGGEDFFIRPTQGPEEDYVSVAGLLPSFVTPATATSTLFIGKSLNQIRSRGTGNSAATGLRNVTAQLQGIAKLSFPLNSNSFAATIRDIRQSLSRDTLEKILPLSQVVDMTQLLRQFLLLGRGEFAMALAQEAEEKVRNRWRRAGNLAHERDGIRNVTVKDGEAAAVLARAWASMSSFEKDGEGEDEQLDRARDLLRLQLVKNKPDIQAYGTSKLGQTALAALSSSPFNNMLFSVPVNLTVQLPSPLDMVISPSDLQIYSCINAYLLSLRRAHIRLTDLWKLTSLRRHYPCPKGADEYAQELRERWSSRALALRSCWTTASAAIFFLGETEAFLQAEVVAGLWQGFHSWLVGDSKQDGQKTSTSAPNTRPAPVMGSMDVDSESDEEDLFLSSNDDDADAKKRTSGAKVRRQHDQQALANGHTLYLDTLAHRLLLTSTSFTVPLYALLAQIDQLVTLVHRLHSTFTSIDLETDSGVVDAFTDLQAEQSQVLAQLHSTEGKVRSGIDDVVAALEALSLDDEFIAEWEGDKAFADDEDDLSPGEQYRPECIGGINRLLMQLNFGS